MEEFRTIRVDDATELVIRTLPFACNIQQYRARLLIKGQYVAAASVLGPGSEMPTANVLSAIEVHPEHRGRRYSVRLMELLQREIGTVYRTGRFSKSGYANSKYLQLPFVPGAEVRVSPKEEYSFVDWSTDEFGFTL